MAKMRPMWGVLNPYKATNVSIHLTLACRISCSKFFYFQFGRPRLIMSRIDSFPINSPGESSNDLNLAQSSSVLSLEGKDQVGNEGSNGRVAEQFHEAILYRPTIQNANMLKAKAER
ncbi:hypothetical protein H5410_023182 [Solanum commersonii]|uniref:Uncharacterized protein n=1 Tax=Solanum commersonii TaxID=4109 RepID=A0A9J5ZHJ8_SOLCO|nr:hypothetical protein H5410_023182 [Solanum commersonii]